MSRFGLRFNHDRDSVTLGARAWVIVTTANPTFASDAGLSDRLLVVRMDRRIWPHLQVVLPSAKREQDRKGFTVFTFGAP